MSAKEMTFKTSKVSITASNNNFIHPYSVISQSGRLYVVVAVSETQTPN
jgi:hypothetical protein